MPRQPAGRIPPRDGPRPGVPRAWGGAAAGVPGQGQAVRFILLDRISELEPGRRIVAQKTVSLAEEYLADHFPRFPVLPGVLVLEAMVQAGAWLVRASLDFAPALVLLREARNVSYRSFVAPGQVLTIEADCKELAAGQSVFAASGLLEGRAIVRAQFSLRHLNLGDSDPALAELDERLRAQARALFGLLRAAGAARSDRPGAGGRSRVEEGIHANAEQG